MDTWAGMHIGSSLSGGTGREQYERRKSKNTKGGHRLPEVRSEMQGDFPLWSSERTYPASALILDFKVPALCQYVSIVGATYALLRLH